MTNQQQTIPRGDTSGRRLFYNPTDWPDFVAWVNWHKSYTVRLSDGTEWRREFAGKWICIRGPR